MSCPINLANIGREKCPTAPGLKPTILVAESDAPGLTIGAATNHVVSTITADAGEGFYEFECARKDNSEDTKSNENGGFSSETKFFIDRQTAAKANILTSMNGVENFIVILKDQNNNRRIHGSIEHPAKINVEPTVTPKNGYNITVMWEEHNDLPLYFTGTAPVAT